MYNKRILAAGLAASIGALALIGVLLAVSGVAYAVPLAGVGGFTIEAEEIRGEGMYIYPGVEETSERDAQPVAVTELQGTEIEGLVLTKEMDASPMPGVDGTVTFVIESAGNETVETDEQMLKYSELHAEESEFSGQVINEYNEDDPREEFDITAPGDAQEGKTINISGEEPGMTLRNVEITGHYLAVSSISIPDLEFSVEHDPDGEVDDEADAGGDESGGEAGDEASDPDDGESDQNGEKNHSDGDSQERIGHAGVATADA